MTSGTMNIEKMYYLKKRKDGTHVITQAYHELAYKTFWRGKIRQHGKPRRNKQTNRHAMPEQLTKKKKGEKL